MLNNPNSQSSIEVFSRMLLLVTSTDSRTRELHDGVGNFRRFLSSARKSVSMSCILYLIFPCAVSYMFHCCLSWPVLDRAMLGVRYVGRILLTGHEPGMVYTRMIARGAGFTDFV